MKSNAQETSLPFEKCIDQLINAMKSFVFAALAVGACASSSAANDSETAASLCALPAYASICNSDEYLLMSQGLPQRGPAAHALDQVLFREMFLPNQGTEEQRARLSRALAWEAIQKAAIVEPARRLAFYNALAQLYDSFELERLSEAFAEIQPGFALTLRTSNGARDKDSSIPVFTILTSPSVPNSAEALQALVGNSNAIKGGIAFTHAMSTLGEAAQKPLEDAVTGSVSWALTNLPDPAGQQARLLKVANVVNEARQQYARLRAEAFTAEKLLSQPGQCISNDGDSIQPTQRQCDLLKLSTEVHRAAAEAADVFIKSAPQEVWNQIHQMSGTELENTKSALGSVLSQSIARLQNLGTDEQARLMQGAGQALQDWKNFHGQVAGFAGVVEDATNDLSHAHSGAQTLLSSITALQQNMTSPGKLTNPFSAMSAVLLANVFDRGLLPVANHNLAVAHGVLRGLPQAQAMLTKSLAQLNSAKSFTDKLSGAADAIGTIANVAQNLGVQIPPEINSNLATLQTGISLASALSGTNPIASLGMVSGLLGGGSLGNFGGGGADAAAAQQHAAIMAALAAISTKLEVMDRKLDEVLVLQRQTLNKLEELSEQLQRSTNLILQELAKLNTKVEYLIKTAEELQQHDFQKCFMFWRGSRSFEFLVAGQVPSYHFSRYERRAAAFKNAREDYDQCRKQMTDTGLFSLDTGVPSPLLRLESVEHAGGAAIAPHLDTIWRPMISLTRNLLNLQAWDALSNRQSRCAGRLIAAAAAAPDIFSNKTLGLVCPNDDSSISEAGTTYHLSPAAGGGSLSNANKLLDNPVYFPYLKLVGDMAGFLLPFQLTYRYHDFTTPLELPSARQLLTYKLDAGDMGIRGPLDPPSRMLDVANWALAQETIEAGVLVADLAASHLLKVSMGSQFEALLPADPKLPGDSDAPPPIGRACFDAFTNGLPPGVQIPPRQTLADWMTYGQIVCAMRSNAAFAANVVSQLARKVADHIDQSDELRDSKVSNFLYRQLYEQQAIPSPMQLRWAPWRGKLRLRAVDGEGGSRNAVWTLLLPLFKNGTSSQTNVEFDLPTPFFLEKKIVVYGVQMASVKRFKSITLQRLVWLRLWDKRPSNDSPDAHAFDALVRELVVTLTNPLGIVGFELTPIGN